MTDPAAIKYRAFLSYSHTDTGWAKWLHGKLEGFRIDKDLVGRDTAAGQIPKTLRPIFRDREDFTAGHTLNDQTLAALDASAALIVLCSPASAKSHYVNEELRLFKSRHPGRPVIPMIVGGTPGDPKDECFAPALKFKVGSRGKIATAQEELLAADVREEGDGRNLAIAKTLARLLGLQTDDVFRRAERERRRRDRIRSAIGLVIAGLLAAGGFLAWQSHQRQQTIAEVEAVIAKYSVADSSAAAVPGAKESLTSAITAIAEGAAGDARYAKALELLKAGKPAEAEPLLKAVAEEKETRAARENKQAAAAYNDLGSITRLSDLKRARDAYAKAAALDPDNLDAWYWSGWLQFDTGDFDASEQAFKRVLALTGGETGGEDVWWARHMLGEIASARGDLASALDIFREAQSQAERLAKADPADQTWQFALAQSYQSAGRILQIQGNLAESLEAHHQSLAIGEQLAKANPDDIRSQRGLSSSLRRVGEVLQAQGNLPEAARYFQDSLAVMDRAIKANPDDVSEQPFLWMSLNRLGDVLLAQGKPTEALKSFQASLAIADRLATADPGNPERQSELASIHVKIGDAQLEGDERAEALISYETSLAMRRHLAETDPANIRWRKDEAACLSNIGNVKAGSGDNSGALVAYEEMLTIMRRLVESDESKNDWQLALAVAFSGIGNAKSASGDAAGALAAYREGVAIHRHLAETDTANVQSQIDLVAALYKFTMTSAGDEKEAAIQEAVKILDRLDSAGKLGADDKVWKDGLLALRDPPKRGSLGLRIQNVPDGMGPSLQLADTKGALVAMVVPGSPAQRDGLEMGDLIVSFGGNAVQDAGGLLDLIAKTEVGKSVTVKLIRDGTSHSLQIEMGELNPQLSPEAVVALVDEASSAGDDKRSAAISGEPSSTQELDPALFDQYFKDFPVSRPR